MGVAEYVASQIAELRRSYNSGEGLSQQALAEQLGVAANTISRWETGTYRPTIDDLEKLSRFFGVGILTFFPGQDEPADERVAALLRAAEQLDPEELDELRAYAEFRKARKMYAEGRRPNRGRKRKGDG